MTVTAFVTNLPLITGRAAGNRQRTKHESQLQSKWLGCRRLQRCKLSIERREAKRRSITAQAEATLSETSTVVVDPSEEVAVGDTIKIKYTPPESWTKKNGSSQLLLLAVGFNGWDGEEKPLMFPLNMEGDGSFRATVTVPNFAKSVEFGFTDGGTRWDVNDGNYYQIPVRYQQRLNKKGELETFVAAECEEKDEQPKRDLEAEGEFQQILKPEEEESLHRIRGEAALIGEREGLGNMQISQARNMFDRYDFDRKGYIKLKDLRQVLHDIDFDLEDERYHELVKKFIAENPSDDTPVPMTAYMLLYSQLENDNEGIEMV